MIAIICFSRTHVRTTMWSLAINEPQLNLFFFLLSRVVLSPSSLIQHYSCSAVICWIWGGRALFFSLLRASPSFISFYCKALPPLFVSSHSCLAAATSLVQLPSLIPIPTAFPHFDFAILYLRHLPQQNISLDNLFPNGNLS